MGRAGDGDLVIMEKGSAQNDLINRFMKHAKAKSSLAQEPWELGGGREAWKASGGRRSNGNSEGDVVAVVRPPASRQRVIVAAQKEAN